MAEREKRGQRVKRKLAKAHEHRGVLHPAGSEIELFPHQAERLEKEGKLAGKSAAGAN